MSECNGETENQNVRYYIALVQVCRNTVNKYSDTVLCKL